MQNAKPVEAGCSAMIVNMGELSGRIVTLLNCTDHPEYGRVWTTDYFYLNRLRQVETRVLESRLIRIDDLDLQTQIEAERVPGHG